MPPMWNDRLCLENREEVAHHDLMWRETLMSFCPDWQNLLLLLLLLETNKEAVFFFTELLHVENASLDSEEVVLL